MDVNGSILRLLGGQRTLITNILGEDYAVVETDRGPVLRAQGVEISFGYDCRDGWISASLKPLGVPQLAQSRPLHFWLRFLGKEEHATPVHQPLSEVHIESVLERLAPVLPLFRDVSAARDAAEFVDGYYTAVSDWLRKRGHWRAK